MGCPVDLQGFEPRTTAPKTVVLPLHYRSFKTLPKGTPEHSQCTKDISALIFGLLLFTVDNVYFVTSEESNLILVSSTKGS